MAFDIFQPLLCVLRLKKAHSGVQSPAIEARVPLSLGERMWREEAGEKAQTQENYPTDIKMLSEGRFSGLFRRGLVR
ncbi:hypothetical protein [Primorskyibacter flagellatus]|uniref:hypothetical protein n=1 Tax=Primorskyibacter flagellatus TaxID=1387277 RepID=UPI001179FF9D|nr:hypothetical protein [Primorskyibacter flagellatus]